MPSYSYRATNEDGQEVRGSLDAPNFETAKRVIEDLHLDAVEIHESMRIKDAAIQPLPQPVLKTTFAFEGKDDAGEIHRGTLQAEDKRQAFERLKKDQKLFLTMLSPLGVTPQFRDHDLENWQKNAMAAPPPSLPQKVEPMKEVPSGVQFSPTKDTATLSHSEGETQEENVQQSYHPIITTLRVYAGWLLAWYGLFVAIGYYTHVRAMPWDIPFVEAFFVSPLIFSFIVAIFLFLFLGSIHQLIKGKILSGSLLTILGVILFITFRVSL